MKTNVYAIFDHKAKIFNRPFYLVNDQVATRTCLDLLADPNTDVAKHPTDFALFKLGTYEDTSGLFTLEALPLPMFGFHELQPETLDVS